ncbi:MAG: hypothetical protein DMF68_08850 [Acidobacteria bacterium]|nr:MAG: hypothetical protein DMF68_08850 [Acidobacteriota bacterium]
MEEAKCPCANLERLEGASVPAYISAYLDRVEGEASEEENRFRCRVCGRGWEKRLPENEREGKRPSLVRLT